MRTEYSLGNSAGAVILKDGSPMSREEIVAELNGLQAARASEGGEAVKIGEIEHDYNLLRIRWYRQPKYGQFKTGDKVYVGRPSATERLAKKDLVPLTKICELLNGMMDGTEEQRYGLLEPWASTYERLAKRLAHSSASVPEGYALVPTSIPLTIEALANILTITGWEEGEDDFGEGLLWVGPIRDDDGTETYGLNISCAQCTEEGALPVHEFQKPQSMKPREA